MKAIDVSATETHAWATERIAKQHLPQPARPRTKEPEFEFPDDPSRLTDIQLGQLILRFAGHLGYATRLLAGADSELTLVADELRLKINVICNTDAVKERLGKVSNAEQREAIALNEHDDLTPLYHRKQQLTAVVKQLEPLTRIYEKMGMALSRELSRREMESRAIRG